MPSETYKIYTKCIQMILMIKSMIVSELCINIALRSSKDGILHTYHTIERQNTRLSIELIKDYDFTLEYHPNKANALVGTLSWKSQGIVASLLIREWLALKTLLKF